MVATICTESRRRTLLVVVAATFQFAALACADDGWRVVPADAPRLTAARDSEPTVNAPPAARQPTDGNDRPSVAGLNPSAAWSIGAARIRQADEVRPTSPLEAERVSLPGFVRIVGATAGVCGLAFLGLWTVRRSGWGRRCRPSSPLELTHHGSLTLGARIGLHLVGAAERRFLVAVDARGVSCISVVPSSFADEMPIPPEPESPFSTGTAE